MPKVGYNDPRVNKLYGGFAKTIRLKKLGQKVNFILGETDPVMYGLHWMDKKAYTCPRVNEEAECQRCQKGFDLLAGLKEKNLDSESKEYKALKKEALDKLPQISFYYPVFVTGGSFDRGAYLLEVTKTSYERLGALQAKGKDLLGLLWELERTEKPGSYYELDDVGELPDLTEEEAEELVKIAELDIDSTMSYPHIDDYYEDSNEVEIKEGEEVLDDKSINEMFKKDGDSEDSDEESKKSNPNGDTPF